MSLRGVLCVLERNGARAPRDQPVQFSPKARAPRGLGPPGAIVDVNFSDQHAHRRLALVHATNPAVRSARLVFALRPSAGSGLHGHISI